MKGKILSSVVGIAIICTGHFGHRLRFHEGSKLIRFRGANLTELTAEVWKEPSQSLFAMMFLCLLTGVSDVEKRKRLKHISMDSLTVKNSEITAEPSEAIVFQ